MAAAGSNDGKYLIGKLPVEVKDGVALLESNGALAGSTWTTSLNDPDPAARFALFRKLVGLAEANNRIDEFEKPELLQSLWKRYSAVADAHNAPGKFTAFVAYEWTSAPGNQNLHRCVIFKGKGPEIPFTSLDSMDPEALWTYLERQRELGLQVVAIQTRTVCMLVNEVLHFQRRYYELLIGCRTERGPPLTSGRPPTASSRSWRLYPSTTSTLLRRILLTSTNGLLCAVIILLSTSSKSIYDGCSPRSSLLSTSSCLRLACFRSLLWHASTTYSTLIWAASTNAYRSSSTSYYWLAIT
jgi:hypothetical protein